jgi:hypothetical protein
MSQNKSLNPERVCVNCHFLRLIMLEMLTENHKSIDVEMSAGYREHFKMEDYEYIEDTEEPHIRSGVKCAEGCWSEDWPVMGEAKMQNWIDCPDFFEYAPGMEVKTARRHRDNKTVVEPVKEVAGSEVSLENKKTEGKDKDVIAIDGVRKLLKYNDNEERLEPRQIELFGLLWEKKDEVVGREEIYQKLWPGEEVSPTQIEQQINKLREGLGKLGFKKEIIKTHIKTQLSEGAYTFHSDLTSFLKQP